MRPNKEELIKEEKIKKLLKNPPQHKFSDEKRRELIARIYKIDEERKSILNFIPFKVAPVHVAVLSALFVIVFGYMGLFSPLYPIMYGTKGTVMLYRSGKAQWILVQKPKVRLRKNDIVKTLGDAQADITIPGLYHMRLKNDSEIRLARVNSRVLPGTIKYNLTQGKVFTYYKKSRTGKKGFEIETPEARASVVGTDFMVQVIPVTNKTSVGVLDGVVRVTGRDIPHLKEQRKDTVFVEAGTKTIVRQGEAPTRPRRLFEDELLELEELYRIGAKPQVALLISTGKTRVRELLSITPLYISSEEAGVLPEKIKKIAKIFSQAIREGSREKHIESIKEFEEIVRQYPNPKYDVQFLLFIGAYYEHLDEHEKAIETFQSVIDGYQKSSLTSVAQCAIGIIYEEKLNDLEKAKIAYEHVMSNYPQSPEVEEAWESLKRIMNKG